MRILPGLLAAAACATARAPAPPPPPDPPVRELPPPIEQAPDLDEAALKLHSHAFYDAIDRNDVAELRGTVGPTFVLFENGRALDADFMARSLQGRADRHAPVRSRAWSNERVYVSGNAAVFIGESVEHIPADAGHPAADYDGYHTLVWVRDGTRWRVAHAARTKAGLDAERELWNDRFRMSVGFKLEPNQLLVETIQGRKPGAALDLLMGQGRNALYLAAHGWKVTGVDISDEGLRIAKAAAAKQKLGLDAIQADVEHWDLGKERWDLVTMIYAGDDAGLVERVKPSLKKGGLFVLEYFHKDSDASRAGAGGWPTGALAQLFSNGFKILRDDVVDDTADWSLSKQKLVRFVAEKL
jgi:hypothetical protein